MLPPATWVVFIKDDRGNALRGWLEHGSRYKLAVSNQDIKALTQVNRPGRQFAEGMPNRVFHTISIIKRRERIQIPIYT